MNQYRISGKLVYLVTELNVFLLPYYQTKELVKI